MYTGIYWGCIFSSSWFTSFVPAAIPTFVRSIPRALFALLFPDNCRICAEPLVKVSRIPVCPKCLAKPEPISAEHFCVACRTPFLSPFPLDADGLCGLCRRGLNAFDCAYSFGSYEDELRQLIHLFKYARIQTLARPLGRMLVSAVPPGEEFDLIVPVPLHWYKRWRRGFNQSLLLAKEVGRSTGTEVRCLVRRVHSTKVQAGLTGNKRRENMRGAFRVKSRRSVANKSVLLIDDVMTTGATAGSCAQALKRAGARRVTLLTVARVDRRLTVAVRDTTLNRNPDSYPFRSLEDAQSGSIA